MKTKAIIFIFFALVIMTGCQQSSPIEDKNLDPVVKSEKGMVKVTLLYPNEEGSTFDMDYYQNKHMPMVQELLGDAMKYFKIDKGLAGTEGAASDGGTTARVIGGLLTWLQERERPVFVAATANRVDALPPELLRRGRLDEIFFVDLPDAAQREAILRVHLQHVPLARLGHVPPLDDPWDAFASVIRAAEGWSGAEIEAALVEARLDAHAEQRPLRADDLRRAVEATVPLCRTRSESIAALRSWAADRARPA